MPCGSLKKANKFFGHMTVPSANVVKNPSTTVARKADKFTAKCFHGNIQGSVGKGAPIAGKGQH